MNPPSISARASLRLAAPLIAATGLALMPGAQQSAVQWLTEICTGDAGAVRPMFASAVTPPGAASRPVTSNKVLSCEPLPNVPGKSMTTVLVNFPPLAYTSAHRHPGAVTAVVVQGTVRSQMEGGPPVDYKMTESWFEPPRALHMFAENPDPVRPAQLLATFVVDENCGPLTIPEPRVN